MSKGPRSTLVQGVVGPAKTAASGAVSAAPWSSQPDLSPTPLMEYDTRALMDLCPMVRQLHLMCVILMPPGLSPRSIVICGRATAAGTVDAAGQGASRLPVAGGLRACTRPCCCCSDAIHSTRCWRLPVHSPRVHRPAAGRWQAGCCEAVLYWLRRAWWQQQARRSQLPQPHGQHRWGRPPQMAGPPCMYLPQRT